MEWIGNSLEFHYRSGRIVLETFVKNVFNQGGIMEMKKRMKSSLCLGTLVTCGFMTFATIVPTSVYAEEPVAGDEEAELPPVPSPIVPGQFTTVKEIPSGKISPTGELDLNYDVYYHKLGQIVFVDKDGNKVGVSKRFENDPVDPTKAAVTALPAVPEGYTLAASQKVQIIEKKPGEADKVVDGTINVASDGAGGFRFNPNAVFSNDPFSPGFDYYVYLDKAETPTEESTTESSSTESSTSEEPTTATPSTEAPTTEGETTPVPTTKVTTTEEPKQPELPNTGLAEVPTTLLGLVALGLSGVVTFKKKK